MHICEKCRPDTCFSYVQRENLSVIETIETIVDLIDSELFGDEMYDSIGESAILRVKNLLAKLDSIRRSSDRGSYISKELMHLSRKFTGQVENIFKNLPNPLKWQSFFRNDLSVLLDASIEVQNAAINHNLNRSQVKALEGLKRASFDEYKRVTGKGTGASASVGELSANEIKGITEKAIKKMRCIPPREMASSDFSNDAAALKMNRLGIPVERIATLLGLNRKTVMKHIQKREITGHIKKAVKAGKTVEQAAMEKNYPLPLAWAIALDGKNEMERFRLLGWGLRTWDYWFYNEVDKRFGDDWPGRIPAHMIAHMLYYFTEQGELVLDPMAGGGVAPDTCLAMNRSCVSFDMDVDPAARPEIEKWFWDPDNMKWPLDRKRKPDFILFDPPLNK